MAENIPPGASTADSIANQPGRPYYESLRTALRATLEKKRKLDEQLAATEDQIFKLEGSYLEETASSGNIVRGFDGWVKGVQVGGRGADDRRRGRVRDDDRVFSRSSVGWMRVCWAYSTVWTIMLTASQGARRPGFEYTVPCSNTDSFFRAAALDPRERHAGFGECCREGREQEEASH